MTDSLSALGDRLISSFKSRLDGAPSAPARAVPEALPADEFELMVVDAGKLWISRRDQVMRPYMARAGTWEPEEGRVLLSLTKPGCRFLDIGANIGYFSALVSSGSPGGHVDAVEPDPTNLRALRFNLWFNEVNSTVWPLALDDSSRALHLSDNEHNLGDLRTGRVEGGGGQAAAKWIVPAASGDDLFADRSFDLVKIDTQGWEFEILLGIDLTLRRSPGVHIVAEFCPQILKDRDRDPLQVLARYRELGYGIRAIVHGAPVDLVDTEITDICATGGGEGQVNLLLSR
jgi:FkbM family methyltransferase